jgi:hypothetical protein
MAIKYTTIQIKYLPNGYKNTKYQIAKKHHNSNKICMYQMAIYTPKFFTPRRSKIYRLFAPLSIVPS